MRFILFAVLQCWIQTALCQTYRSQVVNEENTPIPYATVTQSETPNQVLTDTEGYFTITVSEKNFLLEVTSIGYRKEVMEITNGELPETITLTTDKNALDEVVVTALGIKRETQSLVSSITVLDNERLTEVPETNTVNALAGKVAGVQVTNGSSGVGSSSRIVIRGQNSLSGNNQPLFVVDGVPISNAQITSDLVNDGALQEVDWGNGGAEISPYDIESVSLLKGAGAAALYGSRGANGVVLITTKRGKKSPGLGVSFNTSFTVESLLTVPDYQNVYGGGSNGEYSFQNGIGAGINDGGISSYGPGLDEGLLINQFDSPSVNTEGESVRAGDILSRQYADGSFTPIQSTPWVSRPDNVKDFFETGTTQQSNISLHSNTEKNNTRFSYTNLRNKGVLPNTNLDRDIVSLRLNQSLTEKLTFDTYINYINNRSDNRPNLGYGYENVMYGFNWTGRQTNIASLKDYWQAGQTGLQHYDFNYLWLTNPYLTLNENTNSFDKNRVLGNASLTYNFNDHLTLQARTGADIYNDKREFRRAVSTNRNPFGSYREDNIRFKEINADLLLTYNDDINTDLSYVLSGGGNRFDQTTEYNYSQASQLAIPGTYTLANSRTPLVGNSELFEKRINSLYGYGTLSYQGFLFFDGTYRQDWSSTLPANNNSFGYYSAGLSYVASNHLTFPDEVSFLKFRLSSASVGNDTDPYQTVQTYLLNQNYGSSFRVTNENVLKNPNLRPERLNAYEAGMEAWFFDNRLQIDFSAYENTSKDQIISRPVSNASGFSNYNVNGGKIRTRGFEALVSGQIIENKTFDWQSSVNYSTFRSIVTELPQGVDQFVTNTASVFAGAGGSNSVFFIARENGRVGDMYGTGFVKIDGETLFNSNGLPVQDGNLRLLGNYNPDFSIGFNNKFTYKKIDLSVLFDWRQGGTIVSRTKALGSTSGVLKETLAGRESGIVGNGVMNIGSEQQPQYVKNTTSVSASQFYNSFYDRGNEESALYDASYVKLREVYLSYTFPEIAGFFQDMKLGLVGNNLLLFTENPHFDPELNAFQERNIVYGVEDMSYPSTRSFGISLKTNF